MPRISLAVHPVSFGATDDVPARYHGEDGFDARDAEFLFGDSATDASQSFDVVIAVAALVRCRFFGEYEAFALVHSEGEDRDSEHAGDRADRVNGRLRILNRRNFVGLSHFLF